MLADVCRGIEAELKARPEFAHTSHFLVMVEGQVVHDAHYHGPEVADIFSVTKSVVATLAGIAIRQGLLKDLDEPLLTMTRGCETEGPYDIDEVMALPDGWLARIRSAPRIAAPGAEFRYDNGAAHLFGAALAQAVKMSLNDFAARELFGPLGITEWHWPRDPDGYDYGFGHLRLKAEDLARLGALWLPGQKLMDAAFAREMLKPQTAGGWPENAGYGYFIWIDEHGPFAGGWAGQHVTVVPRARAVIVTTGDASRLRAGWRPARDLIKERLIPAL